MSPEQIDRKLSGILHECARKGWDGYHAEPVPKRTCDLAVRVAAVMRLYLGTVDKITPTTRGTIELEWDEDICLTVESMKG